MSQTNSGLLGPSDIRALADELGVRPTKVLGQNFVHDAGTVRRIVREAGVDAGDYVLEVGPGLGSLTLALLEAGAKVSAVEIDERLARQLPVTIETRMPEASERCVVTCMDALDVNNAELIRRPQDCTVGEAPTKLVANLPYNVAVPVLLTLLEAIPSLQSVLVMVQTEVAERLAAAPGSRTYGVPSVKAAWYGKAFLGSKISRSVFWPEPNVDSSLVGLVRHQTPQADRDDVFAVIDAAFAQRRKTLRAALAGWAGSAAQAEDILRTAGIDPKLRGEKLGIDDYIAIAQAKVW